MSTRPLSPESGWLDAEPEGSAEARVTPHPASSPAIANIATDPPTPRTARMVPIITPATQQRKLRRAIKPADVVLD